MLCDDLGGWDEGRGGRSTREGIYVFIQLIRVVVQPEPTEHCKAIVL